MSENLDTRATVAEQAARAAGQLIRNHLQGHRRVSVRYKGPRDPVTEVDVACQAEIRRILLGAFPDDGFLGEEEGDSVESRSGDLWVVDPLDGTKNFAHGYPVVCVAIGLERAGQIVVGVVYDPMRDELFSAVQGHGARLNGQPIAVSEHERLEHALVMTGFARACPEQFALLAEVERRSEGIRRDGSAALNLCYVASGRLGAFWELGLSPWDVAGASLILKEAGGCVTTLSGGEFDIRCRQLLATNVRLHRELVELIAPFREGLTRGLKPYL